MLGNMAKTLRITFVLPGNGHNPIGGFKVVYEYANHLARRGHEVTIIHPALLDRAASGREVLRSTLRYVYWKSKNQYRPTQWFQIDPSVRLLWVPSLDEQHIPAGDAIIATAWQTAEALADYPCSKGKRFYLIQHLETWNGSEERVYATWKLPLAKIVIAKWLKEIADSLGENCVYIPNGLDFEGFSLDIPPEQRDPYKALMLCHTYDWKGSKDGLEALSLARRQIPNLSAVLFGVSAAPPNLPEWVEYHRCPDQKFLRQLYNEAAVFVAPSWTEGWPLPPAEAMMCGAALVATDIGGHREYAFDEKTALLSPAKMPLLLAENIMRIMRSNDLHSKLACQGHTYMQQFTWQRATDALEALLLSGEHG
jgi:glycosyltransferase involved in cell wall biosynthesis